MIKYFLKKSISILICISIILSASACTQKSKKTSDKLNVVTVIFPQYDMARAICSDTANVTMIMHPGAEVHGYEPSLSDIITIEEADVFIYGGGESDVWIERILKSIDTSNMKIISLMNSKDIYLYEEEAVSTSHDHGSEHHSHNHNNSKDTKYDEHIWTSPRNAINILNVIEKAISDADLANKDIYAKNAKKYRQKLSMLDYELTDICSKSKNNFIVCADRFPFLYMAKDYNISYMAAFSGCSPESDAGPSVIAEMIDEIKHHDIDSIFHIELSNERMADAISEHTGVKKMLLHSCQSISRKDFKNGVSYADLMNNNIKNLREALN